MMLMGYEGSDARRNGAGFALGSLKGIAAGCTFAC